MTTENKPLVLVVEDDPDGRRSVTEALQECGYAVASAATGSAGLRLFGERQFDAALCDVKLPDIDGQAVLTEIRRVDSEVPVLLMTAYGTVAAAVAALKAGAYDYILKPLDLVDLQSKMAHALETRRLRVQVTALRQRLGARAIVAQSSKMLEIVKQAQAVAATQATVLIVGESGTGKELIARVLHFEGNHADGPFVAVSCGAFSETLLESELFGHEKGAFTGAVQRHLGAFERAHGGTLFLDEIGIAPQSVQARLLRVLEEREIVRVGGQEPVPIDVRIVSATNRNLDDLVAEKAFRNDLLYRLQVVTLVIPPLRERPEDIRPLADHFIALACAENGRHIDAVAPEYYAALEQYRWPGNARELKNAIEASVVMAATPRLTPALLKLGNAAGESAPTAVPRLTLAELEQQALLQALRQCKGSRTLTAEQLGVSTRTIQRKIKEYNLPF